MGVVSIEYSKDFRKSEIQGEVYGIIRDNGFKPSAVSVHYNVGMGLNILTLQFNSKKSPHRNELEEMLKGMDLKITFPLG